MLKIVLSVMAVLILTGMAFSQDVMRIVPQSDLIDQGPVNDNFKYPVMKNAPKKVMPDYFAPPSGRGVFTGITGYWDYQSNGGAIDYLEVSPNDPNQVHAIMMVATDSGSTVVINASRRTAYNFSSDGGETWGTTPEILNIGPFPRSGYPQMTIENVGGVYLTNVVNHATHPTPLDEENPLATTISLQQLLFGGFGDARYAQYEFPTNSAIWPMVKVAANGNNVVLAGRQNPPGGVYVTTFNVNTFEAWTPIDTLSGGARPAMAVSPGGKVALGWFGSPGTSDTYTIYFKESNDNGVTWGPQDSISKEVNGYVGFTGFDMSYVGEKLYIVSMGAGFVGTSISYASSRIRIWDSESRTSRIVIDSVNFPFLAKTMKYSQSGHFLSFTFPAISKSATGTRLFVLCDAFMQGVTDSKGFNYSDVIYTYSDDGGFTWADVKNLTRTSDLDERYVTISNFNPIINDSSWMYFGFQEDRVPGRNIVVPDGDSRPVSKNAFKFMRLNTDYIPTKDLIVINVDLVNYTEEQLHAVDVPESVKVIIKNDGLEANPSTVTITFKGNSLPVNENDGVKQVFNPVWGGLGGKYAYLKFSTLFIPKFASRDTTVFVCIFYTGDEDPSTNDGKKVISILPRKDLALEYVAQINPTIQPKTTGTPYIPVINWETKVANVGGDPTSGAYLLRYSINDGPIEFLSRPAGLAYNKKEVLKLNLTPTAIGTYDLKVWPTLTGDINYTNDTISMKLRAHQSNSFAIAYDDSNDTHDTNWAVDSARYDLTTGVRFTAPRSTRLLSADVVFTTSFRDTLADSIVVTVRNPGIDDSSSGSILWSKSYLPNTPEGFPYFVRTSASQWVSFPIDQELLFTAGQDFWVTISYYLRSALKTTGRSFPQGTDYYPMPYKIYDPNNRSFFSENYGNTWHALREDYWWKPVGPSNRIVLRNLVRAICLDSDLTDEVSVRTGWNMVSIPVRRTDSKTNLFPTATSNAFTYRSGAYAIDTTLTLGPAYWLKFPAASTFSIFGGFVYETEFPVTPGWNMIGSIIKPTSVSAITSEPADNISSPYYEYGASGYATATQIRPGFGYWIKVKNAGVLKLQATTLAKEETELAELSKFNSITITDKFNNSQTLYFGENTDGNFPVAYYTLPPSPPAGVLDVRFASQRLVEAYPAQFEGTLQYPININADAYPITISWNLANRTRSFFVENSSEGKKQSTISLSGEKGSKQILQASSIILTIDSKGLPTEFMLGQNYPNPFNPSTKFEFAMPKNARVEVTVYDILGSKVATLFDGMKDAGYHSVEWNGQNSQGHIAPSGVYFIKMTSDGFSAVRKALMLK
ncbi:MAG: FlgD immunoglobulin-like domain containing protein [Bacteroidota bacterium]|nr:FlgD immunoglobulin-like domain containing protein [Bacteroidota bacterium]